MTALDKRRCGPCKACCSVLKIDTPEFRKPAQTLCPHHTGRGCGIYEIRPGVCREFLCGWRLFAELDDSWRPDLSGVLILRKAPSELPPAWRDGGYGVHLAITGGEDAVTRPGFAEYVAGLMKRGIAVYMSAASPATLVNEHMDAAAMDMPAIRERLAYLSRLLHASAWKRGIRMIGALYRLNVERQRALVEKRLKIK